MNGPHRLFQGKRNRARDCGGGAFRLDLERSLDQWPQQLRMVYNLMRVARARRAIDNAGDDDEWHPLLCRVGNAVDGICKTRPDGRNKQFRIFVTVLAPAAMIAAAVS